MDMQTDQYFGFGLAELSTSIFASLGVADAVDHMKLGESPTGRECFLLIDGMGVAALAQYGHLFPIFSQLNSLTNISTYFPSTTAVSLSSVGTGVLPGVHGMLGLTLNSDDDGLIHLVASNNSFTSLAETALVI